MQDNAQAHPYSQTISPSRSLLQHSMPGVPAMLMPLLSAPCVPAALDHGTEIYRPSRDDNGHQCASTRRKYSNFTSCAPYFRINRLLFTFPTIRYCRYAIYYSAHSLGCSCLVEISLWSTDSPDLPHLPVLRSVYVPLSLCHSPP